MDADSFILVVPSGHKEKNSPVSKEKVNQAVPTVTQAMRHP
jgi:hypothetical protein